MKTVSLSLSEQLKEAGYPEIDNEFYWVQYISEFRDNATYFLTSRKEYLAGRNDYFTSPIASPTADEILDLLPWRLDFGDKLLKFLVITKLENGYEVGYENDSEHGFVDGYTSGNTLADALAKMYLYLKKENLI